jgi:hypothetical protein
VCGRDESQAPRVTGSRDRRVKASGVARVFRRQDEVASRLIRVPTTPSTFIPRDDIRPACARRPRRTGAYPTMKLHRPGAGAHPDILDEAFFLPPALPARTFAPLVFFHSPERLSRRERYFRPLLSSFPSALSPPPPRPAAQPSAGSRLRRLPPSRESCILLFEPEPYLLWCIPPPLLTLSTID